MRVLFDTSVLVPALVSGLRQHEKAADLLRSVHRGEMELHVATHALAESFATLTSLPLSPLLSPGQAGELIRRNILDKAKVVTLNARDYRLAIDKMISRGLPGGAIYDALHIRAAEKAEVARLYTFNGRDFRRMPPERPVELVVL